MTANRWAAATAMLLALAACATGAPTLPRQGGVSEPAGWTQPVTAGTAPLAQWWRLFDDALLVRLVEDALATNTDLAIAQANLRQARAARDVAAAALLPQLSGAGSAQRAAAAGAGARNAFQAGLDASWDADLFGGTRHAVEAQQALAAASAATLAATQVSITAEVAQSYLQLRGAQERLAVARDNLAIQQETLQISAWRRQAGLAAELEVEQARTAVEQTRAQVPLLQASAAQLAHALAVLTGRAPQALVAELSVPAPLPQPREDVAVAPPVMLIATRADVRAAEERVRAAAEAVGQADAARLPRLDLGASLAFSGATLGSVGSVSAARSLLASLAQPLFDAGQRDGQRAQRLAEYEAAREAWRAAALGALQQVEDALVALATDRERLAALQRAEEGARAAAQLAAQRHAGGLVDFLTVLDTQRTLLAVQDSVASARAGLAGDQVRLYQALGGGWDGSGASP